MLVSNFEMNAVEVSRVECVLRWRLFQGIIEIVRFKRKFEFVYFFGVIGKEDFFVSIKSEDLSLLGFREKGLIALLVW